MHVIRLAGHALAFMLACGPAPTAWAAPSPGADARPSTAPAVPAAPEDGGPRNWELTGVSSTLRLREQPSPAAPVVASLPPGTILDNLGCQASASGVWCDVQPLGGGPRGYAAAAYLRPAVSPDGRAATGPDDSAVRAGQGQFDATGQVRCARQRGQPTRLCAFGVARAGGGYATVVITPPDGPPRTVFFRLGRPIGTAFSEAGGEGPFRAKKEGDLHLIRIGNERYEIPDAVVLGG